jgi:peptide/nickel transport system substrate-binding protein/oligopeptide transport system substrate-binding protein
VITLGVNPSVAALQIERGQTDLLAGTLPKASYYSAILTPQYRALVSRSLAWYTYQLALNTSVKPFNNLKVREAVALAIGRTQISKALGPYWIMPTVQRLPKGFPGYSSSITYPAENLAKARQLLKAAGFPHGFTTTYVVGNWPDVTDDTTLAEVIQSQLAKIGIRVKIKVEGSAEVATAVNTRGETPMFTVWWGADFADPYDFLNAQFGCSDFPPHGDNQMFWCDPKVDQLDNEALTELQRPKELALYIEAEKIIQASYIYVPLFQTYTVTMHSSRLTNFSVNPIYQWDFAQYKLK